MSFQSERIESPQNGRVKAAKALHRAKERRARGAWLLEGPHLLDEALEGRCRALELFYTAEWAEADEGAGRRMLERLAEVQPHTRFLNVAERVMGALATSEHPQGVALVVEAPVGRPARAGQAATTTAGAIVGRSGWDEMWLCPQPLVIVADALQDPGNVGTIIRSAAAAGATGVILTEGSVDPGNPKVIRATAGAVFRLPVASGVPVTDILAEANTRSLPVYLLEADGGEDYFQRDLTRPAIVVVGNEAHGPSSAFRNTEVQTLSIPMVRELESLNAGVAVSVVLFEAARQRGKRGRSSRGG